MNWRHSPSSLPTWTTQPAQQLDRGQRVTELMKQAQYSPMSVGEMAVSLFAADRGYLDDVELVKIGAFETALQDYMSSQQPCRPAEPRWITVTGTTISSRS